MKKILLYLASTIALVGCMNEETFIVDNPVLESYESFSAPLEISVGESQTKAFDGELKWTWEESDKIYGYQVAGGKSVNTLTFVEDNRFGTPEFTYASEDAATFHFVYAGDATLDEAAEGNRGIRQDSRQSGEWRPVLVGSAVGKTISEVMNDEAEIDMEHLSAALEVRLWKEGVDKNNLTDADKKNIVYAELMSDTENFLLDIVPVYNQDGTVSYTERERGEDEENGGYIRTEYVNSPVVVFNIAPHAENYQTGALRLAIMDENGDRYVLDVPVLNFVAGQRTILNVEWKTPTSAYLPDGPTFNNTVDAFMTGKGITEIKFITNSATTSEDALVEGSIYLLQNGQTLEIHTAASQFMANSSCSYMFAGNSYDDNLSKWVDRTLKQIKTIDFGDNFNTQNVTSMFRMFDECSSLTSLDLSNFDTQNVTNMLTMFWGCSSLTSLDVSNFDTRNVTSMVSMFSGCSNLTSLDVSNFDTQNVTSMGNMFYKCSSLTSLDLSNFETQKVSSMGYMFSYCSSLTLLDLSNFDTQNVTDMRGMFKDCSSLTLLDLSNFDTQNVTDMIDMFYKCSRLTSLDLSNFNTQNVTNMGRMFLSCYRLTSLDLSNFDTQNVTDMSLMFDDCTNLTSLDLSNFDTQNVTSMGSMFWCCSSLTSLDVSNFVTQNVTRMDNMFFGCSRLTSLDLSNFNTQNVTNMDRMFLSCTRLTSLDLSNFTFESNPDIQYMLSSTGSNATNKPIPIYVSAEGKNYIETKGGSNISSNYAILIDKESFIERAYLPDGRTFNSTVDAFMTGKGITEIKFITNSATTSEDALVDGIIYLVQNGQALEIHTAAGQFMANTNCSRMFAGDYYDFNLSEWVDGTLKQIKTIDFGENFNTQNVTNMGDMFYNCRSLTSLDVSNFDTQNMTDMGSMFGRCSSLTSLDLSNFDTQNVTDMSAMFRDCSSLTSLDVSNFNTQNVTDMSLMFFDCTSLTSLDLSNFDTQNVTNMGDMFYNCRSLTSLDVSNFDTQNVTDMRDMFWYCSSLTSLDLSNFDTQNVTDMSLMFYGCSSLTSLDVSNFDTQNVTNMSLMFRECSSLTSLDVSKFNTQNVTNMGSMFSGCSNLTSLDLSNFDTQKVTSMRYMFSSCTSLTSLDLSNFDTQNVTDMSLMFFDCTSLTSLDLSNFTFESNPDIQYMFSSTGSNATNKPIPIYVSAEGKSYIETKGDSNINSNYATLTIKAPQAE